VRETSVAGPIRASVARLPAARHAWWFPLLLSTVCLEGLARRYLPVPGVLLYFAKDIVLLMGLLTVGVGAPVSSAVHRFAGPLVLFLAGTVVCCTLSLLDPSHPSRLLGLVGARQYLLWWIAPLLVATALGREDLRARSERVLAVATLAICALAAYQFEQPTSARVNAYAWSDDPTVIAGVASTGRVRVSSTFSYISGFADFATLAVPLLLAAAIHGRDRWTSRVAYVAAGALVASAPMSGSRATVLYVALGGLLVVVLSGVLKRRQGWATLLVVGLIAGGGYALAPDAVQGVQDRFDSDDTSERFRNLALVLPFYTLASTDYPLMGAGVGTLQNASAAIDVQLSWQVEAEPQRVLIELGPVGYLLVWLSRATLALALVRIGIVLRRSGQAAWSGAAVAYALFTMVLPLSTDHVAQALLFCGTGLILARGVAVDRSPTKRPAG
jgi:hypothetical protein